MLLFYYINLVKLEMLWLSKKVGRTYNLGLREYNIIDLAPQENLHTLKTEIQFYQSSIQWEMIGEGKFFTGNVVLLNSRWRPRKQEALTHDCKLLKAALTWTWLDQLST